MNAHRLFDGVCRPKTAIRVLLAVTVCQGLWACNLVPRAPERADVVGPEQKTRMDEAALEAAVFQHGRMLLEEGKWEEAREIFERLLQSPEPCPLCSRAYFSLGLVELLEMKSPAELEKHRDYMRAYSLKYPGGPCRRNAERIAELLDAEIERFRRESEKGRQLHRRLEAREKEIETLKFQIQELERIHEETEKMPGPLDLKENR